MHPMHRRHFLKLTGLAGVSWLTPLSHLLARADPPENPDLWTLGQSAAFLGLAQRDLLALLRAGTLRYVRRGLRYRIHRAELDRYRAERDDPSQKPPC